MLAPLKLRSLGVKPVVQDETTWTFGASAMACAVVNVGSTELIDIWTVDTGGPSARPTSAL